MSEWSYDVTNVAAGTYWVSIRASGERTLLRTDMHSDGEWWFFAEQVYACIPRTEPQPKAPATVPEPDTLA